MPVLRPALGGKSPSPVAAAATRATRVDDEFFGFSGLGGYILEHCFCRWAESRVDFLSSVHVLSIASSNQRQVASVALSNQEHEKQ